jgi:hypothetical protein
MNARIPFDQRPAVCPLGRGNLTGWSYGCRCQQCASARSDYYKSYRKSGHRSRDDVDEVIVQRIIDGLADHRTATVAEREHVIRRMNRQNITDLEIARRTGINPRTVLRIRQRLDLPAVPPAIWAGRRAAA